MNAKDIAKGELITPVIELHHRRRRYVFIQLIYLLHPSLSLSHHITELISLGLIILTLGIVENSEMKLEKNESRSM